MKKEFIAHLRKSDRKEQSLWQHLEETSKLSGQFAAKIGLKDHGELIGLLHDIGKASSEFKNYIESAVGIIDPDEDDYVDVKEKKGKVDHSSAGAQIIYGNLSDKGKEGICAAQILSLAIASHHSGLIDCLSPDGRNNFQRRITKNHERTHTEEALDNFDVDERKKIDDLFNENLLGQLNDTFKILDESTESENTRQLKRGLLVRFLYSCLIDADRLSTADFEFPGNTKLRNNNDYSNWEILIDRFNTKKFSNKNKIDALRKEVSETCFNFSTKEKGLYQLTVPTGGGKTFASLRFALHHAKTHNMDRIIYVIPYTSIIDQNAEETRKVLEEKDTNGSYLNNVVLEHHSNLTPDEETRRQNLLSENWDAPVVFTTSVQFLEALFGSGTRSARRMHQLANAVIIFDEIQTIPIRCIHMFNVAVRFLVKGCGSTVILCTATQPLLDKVEPKQRALEILPGHKIISDVSDLFRKLKRVEILDRRKTKGWTQSEIVNLAKKEIKRSKSVLIVVNTKASAKYLYQQFKEMGWKNIYHLSTDMCPAHRMNVLAEIKDRLNPKKPKQAICISTQLIEAGVDIDFGTVIRYLAGLDSIIQAAGRCNRHGLRKKHGTVFIVNPKDEKLGSASLSEIRLGGEITQKILDEFKDTPEKFENDILSPSLMEYYYRHFFYARKDRMNYPFTSKSSVGSDGNLFDLFSVNSLALGAYKRINNSAEPSLCLKQSFQTASKAFKVIDSPTRGVILPYGKEGIQIINDLCAAFELEKQYKLLKKAQRYSVNVYENVFIDLTKRGIIQDVQREDGTGIYYLNGQYYSEEFGISKEIVNEMETYIA